METRFVAQLVVNGHISRVIGLTNEKKMVFVAARLNRIRANLIEAMKLQEGNSLEQMSNRVNLLLTSSGRNFDQILSNLPRDALESSLKAAISIDGEGHGYDMGLVTSLSISALVDSERKLALLRENHFFLMELLYDIIGHDRYLEHLRAAMADSYFPVLGNYLADSIFMANCFYNLPDKAWQNYMNSLTQLSRENRPETVAQRVLDVFYTSNDLRKFRYNRINRLTAFFLNEAEISLFTATKIAFKITKRSIVAGNNNRQVKEGKYIQTYLEIFA